MFHNVYYLSLENLELQQATKAIRIENISSIILFYKKKNKLLVFYWTIEQFSSDNKFIIFTAIVINRRCRSRKADFFQSRYFRTVHDVKSNKTREPSSVVEQKSFRFVLESYDWELVDNKIL